MSQPTPPQSLMRAVRRVAHPFLSMNVAVRRLSIAVFLWGLGEGLWLYIRPLYITDLGGTPAQAGQVLGIMGLATVLVMLPSGWLSDRFHPRHLLITTWWIGTMGSLVLALAPTWEWTIPGYFLYALSSGAIPAMNAYAALAIVDHLGAQSGQRVQSAVSNVFAAYMAGTIISPMIGGWLGEAFGLRVVFYGSTLWFFISALVIHSTPRIQSAASVAIPDASAAPVQAASAPWQNGLRVRIYGVLLAVFLMMGVGYALVPNYLEDVRALPLGVIGGLGTVTAIGGVVLMLALKRYSSRWAVLGMIGLMILAMGGLLFAPVGTLELPSMMAVYFMLGAYHAVRPLATGVVSDYAPQGRRGTSFGLLEMLFGVGTFIGPWAAGLLYGREAALPFAVALVALVPLLVAVWLLIPAARKTTQGQSEATPVNAR